MMNQSNKSTADQFRDEVKAHLDRLTTDMTNALKGLLKTDFPSDMHEIAFEVFSDRFTRGFPLYTYFMDEDFSQCCTEKGGGFVIWNPPGVSPRLLNVPFVYPRELEAKYDAIDPQLDAWSAATRALIDWFDKCWAAAGGREFALGATIAHHDSTRRFNLKTGEWEENS